MTSSESVHSALSARFWEKKTLSELNQSEWEALCDGCGICCLIKLEHEHSGEVFHTRVACKLLDRESCQCTDYPGRMALVDDCIQLTPQLINEISWLPKTCAYRRVLEHKPLPEWHYLISGDREAVHRAGVSVRGKTFSEENIHDDELEEHIIHWVE